MNIYGVDAGELCEAIYEDREVNAGHWECVRGLAIVRAHSYGQARMLAADALDIEFTHPMSIRVIISDVLGEPAILDDTWERFNYWPPLWWAFHKIFTPDLTIHNFIGDY